MISSKTTTTVKDIDDLNKLAVQTGTTKTVTAKAQNRSDARRKDQVGKTYAELLAEFKGTGKVWEDPDFPAESSSVFVSTSSAFYRKYEWKRPREINENPKLFVEGISRFDVKQGVLGDCWLLAVIATLSMHEDLFYNVVPKDQDFEENYIGAFRFRFWSFGKWREVTVDDRLPTKNGKLVFMHSTESNEFWSPLLEKAYAKLCGNYESLSGGSQLEAMEDFTGGLCETIKLNETDRPQDLFNHMIGYVKQSSLLGCAIESKIIEGVLENGLITGHAYSITGLKQITLLSGESVDLVRVRNPWGNDKEWKGKWSDNSQEWKTVIDEDMSKLLTDTSFKNDGEFWMSFKDFVSNFTKLEVCHLGPASLESTDGEKRRWEMALENGSWIKNVNAGGCKKYIDSFIMNPQYRVKVVGSGEGSDEIMGTLIIGLMQKDMRSRHLPFYSIGYAIYNLQDPKSEVLTKPFLKYGKTVAITRFSNQREMCAKHRLPPGHYVVIPSTFEPNQEADYMLRIFTDTPIKTRELDAKNNCTEIAPHLDADSNEIQTAQLEAELVELFKSAAGPTEVLNATQLKQIVNKVVGRDMTCFVDFDFEVCRSMIALFDNDCTGRMELSEFLNLFKNLRIWKNAFKEFDVDNSGTFNAFEFRNALNNCGLSVSNSIFKVLANRYSEPEQGVITFTDFIMAVIRLTNAFETMKHQARDEQKRLTFLPEEFVQSLLYM